MELKRDEHGHVYEWRACSAGCAEKWIRRGNKFCSVGCASSRPYAARNIPSRQGVPLKADVEKSASHYRIPWKADHCVWGCEHTVFHRAHNQDDVGEPDEYFPACARCHRRFDAAVKMMQTPTVTKWLGVSTTRKPVVHGTTTKYRYGCRCDLCKQAKSVQNAAATRARLSVASAGSA